MRPVAAASWPNRIFFYEADRIAAGLFSQVLIEEVSDLFERLFGLGRINVSRILRVRLALVDLQDRLDAGLAQLAMHAHRVAQQQIARAAW